MLHLETVDTRTWDLLNRLMTVPEFCELYLAGGTALALQVGHRKSIDLDLFGKFIVDEYRFSSILKTIGNVRLINQSANIKTYLINNIKTDFVNYPYQWLNSPLVQDGIRLTSKADIAAMKLAAVTGRGTKKDFIDIFILLEYFTLKEMFQFYCSKFPEGSEFLVLKSLTWFEDAEPDRMPVMLTQINWEDVKTRILFETKRYISNL